MSSPIVGGVEDTGDRAVVGVGVEGRVFCSGTVISAHVVVTAAHCLADAPDVVYFGDPTKGVFAAIASAQRHPSFDAVTLANDIAALVLDRRAPVKAMPLRRAPMDPSTLGAAVKVVGFGASSVRSLGAEADKRAGTSVITAVDEKTFSTRPGPSQPCGGDSGGAAILEHEGVAQLAGVVSAGDFGCRTYALFTRVDAYEEDFLEPIVEKEDPKRSTARGGCAMAPSPGGSGFGLLALVAVVALSRARAKPVRTAP